MTASLKNVLVGAIHKYSNRRMLHGEHSIHYLLASLARYVYPQFVIVDGTIGMQDGGPVRGTETQSNWVLSSFDALAADTVATYLMGFEIDDVG